MSSFSIKFTKLATTASLPFCRNSSNILHQTNKHILKQYYPLLFQQASWMSSTKKRKTNTTEPLMNTRLTKQLQKNNQSMVRLVIDKGDASVPAEVHVLSLKEAIEKATAFHLDLVGINLQQDPPVIKAVNYKKLLYDQKKKIKAAAASSHDSTTEGLKKKPKEWSFKTGIDPNDLLRKLRNVVDYLEKGYQCNILIQTKRRHKRSVGGGEEEVNLIMSTIHDFCKDVVAPQTGPPVLKGNGRSLRLQPKRNK